MEALDNSLRDIMGQSDILFGGKTIVFGGISDRSSLLCGKDLGLK